MSEVNPLDMIEHLQEYGAGVEHDTSLISKHINQNDLNSELIALVKKIERFHQIKKQIWGMICQNWVNQFGKFYSDYL
jgi:hypothetical protein